MDQTNNQRQKNKQTAHTTPYNTKNKSSQINQTKKSNNPQSKAETLTTTWVLKSRRSRSHPWFTATRSHRGSHRCIVATGLRSPGTATPQLSRKVASFTCEPRAASTRPPQGAVSCELRGWQRRFTEHVQQVNGWGIAGEWLVNCW